MSTVLNASQIAMHKFAPKFGKLGEDVVFGDVWERPELSKRDRCLVTVACLISTYRVNELPYHLGRAVENGLSREELVEAITHLAFYAGWPCAVSAMSAAMKVFEGEEPLI